MFELIHNHPQADRVLLLDDTKILRVQNVTELALKDMIGMDAVLAEAGSPEEAVAILSQVRKSGDKRLSLMPVLVTSHTERVESISDLFDEVFNSLYPSMVVSKIKQINNYLNECDFSLSQIDNERAITMMLSQYLYSRKADLLPKLSRLSNVGYAYPLLVNLMSFNEGIRMLDFLDQLFKQGYLDAKTKEKVHACESCHSGYLNYRECCPSCGSADLKTSDLIHHFVCAHVAPEDDFKKEDKLECPKCDKTLRHIGIDYDKPSAMYSCNSCKHDFQTPHVKALCVDCSTDNSLSQLISREVKEYKLTSKGELLAKKGFESLDEEKQEVKSNAVSSNIYELFKRQEIFRAEGSNDSVHEAIFMIKPDLISELSKERQELIKKEILVIIGHYLSKLDLVTAPNTREYKVLFVQKQPDVVSEVSNVILNNISRLLSDGLSPLEDSVSLTLNELNHA